MQRAERKTTGFVHWELFTSLQPGEYYSRDMERTRAKLHAQAICPNVARSGMGRLKTLRYNDCVVHSIPQETDVCCEFLARLARVRPHSVVYRGESFASFGQLVFDALCSVDPRQPPSHMERQAALAKSQGLC